MANVYKQQLEDTIIKFIATTGIFCSYEKQFNNGSWLWFRTKDNNNAGMYIEVSGRVDAINTLNTMLNGYNLKATGKFN